MIDKGTNVNHRIGSPVQYTEQNAHLAAGTGSAAPPAAVKTETKPPMFYGQAKKAEPPSPIRGNVSFGNSNLGDSTIVPIRDITPYNSKCTIKARVTNKGPVRTWSNSRGDGKLFSMDLLDDSGEVRMTGFNNAVDQFYDFIKVNEVYIISKFSAKPANKQFTNLNHEYEISFMNDTQVLPCMDADADNIPTLSFQFTEIAFIEDLEKDKIIGKHYYFVLLLE